MAQKIIKQLRDFPSVEELLQSKQLSADISALPRPLAAEVVRQVVAEHKDRLKREKAATSGREIVADIRKKMASLRRMEISRVINATGIVVHTNLGRAPLSEALFDAVREAVVGYGNVEFDSSTGARGHRGCACEKYLAILSGAESATVVNNCAAALFVILNTLANRKKVVISRGELVQIGGGFRIPDILKKSGAKLCEIGTTNITLLTDYEENIDEKTALILKVHQSNFVQHGFTERISLKELVTLGMRRNLPVVNDLGSGAVIPTRETLGYSEPTVQQSVRDGAALTCFSGDKMLGGVQAGLIVGRADLVKRIKRNPIFRTIRVDKIVFSTLERLLVHYLNGQWRTEVKLWSILTIPESELYRRGKALLRKLGNPPGISVEATSSYVGGGALPESSIPSVGIVFSTEYRATALQQEFRKMTVPIIGRIDDDRFVLDLKAVEESDMKLLEDALSHVINR